jgi:SAM-dependent methyltransferase
MDTNIQIAKALMKMWPAFPPSPDQHVGELQEVFNHDIFLKASQKERNAIMLQSSQSKYLSECEYPWDYYFGVDLKPYLKGSVALDLGCFNGGRGVAWFERYKLAFLAGVDVNQTYIDAARQFANLKQINADYRVATGENLPFEGEMFNAILSFDVFEHVRNVRKTLNECYRVLKPDGRLFLVFPSYYQPVEHHLSLVTKFPGIHYLFSARTLVKAYCEILEERGPDAYWYKRSSTQLESWEKGNAINGTTLAQFRRLLTNSNWQILRHSRKPLGSIGRNVSKRRAWRTISHFFYPLIFVPGLQEIFLHRITFILEKKGTQT